MTAVKIAALFWLRDKLAYVAMALPWSDRLSRWETKITTRLDALWEGGGE